MQREAGAEPGREWLTPGLRFMVASAFFFSVMSLLVKLAGQRLPSQQIVWARSLVMLLITLVHMRRLRIHPLGVERRLLVLRGVLGFGALSCFYYALVHLPLPEATVIQYTNPAFTALFAVGVLGERLYRRDLTCIALSMTGVLLVAQPPVLFGGGGLPPVPALVGLLGALLSGAAYVVVRRLGAEHHLVIIFYFATVSVIASTPAALVSGLMPTPAEVLLLVGVGIATHLGQVYMTRGLSLERAGRATATSLVQIVFATLWGALFFSQFPGPLAVLGSLLVIGAVLLLSRG